MLLPTASLLGLALYLPLVARSEIAVEGESLRVFYNDTGTWNDSSLGGGLQYRVGSDWVDMTSYGIAYALIAVSFEQDGPHSAYAVAGTESDYDGPSSNFELVSFEDISTDDQLGTRWLARVGSLEVEKSELWCPDEGLMRVRLLFSNTGTSPVNDLAFLFGTDPDQYYSYGESTLISDVDDLDKDGVGEWVMSASRRWELTLGFGACPAGSTTLGHYEDWRGSLDTDVTLEDLDGDRSDDAMGLHHEAPAPIEPGETWALHFLVSAADDPAQAAEAFEGALNWCDSCDVDLDGVNSEECRGADCNDIDAAVGPGAKEIWYDGVDQDCDGADDYDQDADGFPLDSDCDDLDPSLHEDCEGDTGGGDDTDGGDDTSSTDTAQDHHDTSLDGGKPVVGSGQCGCAMNGRPSMSLGLLLAGLLALGRRRVHA